MRLILILALWAPCATLSAQPAMQKDPTGSTQYMSPRGWKAKAEQQNGAWLWMSEERPGSKDGASVAVVAMNDPGGALEAIHDQMLRNVMPNFKVGRRAAPTAAETHCIAEGRINGLPARTASLAIRDQGYVFFSIFAAKTADYDRLGAERLIYAVVQRDNPFTQTASPTPTPAHAPAHTPATAGGALLKQRLLGEWMQAVGVSTGEAYQSIVSGAITYGSKGYGHIIRFLPNDRYELFYLYKNFYGGYDNSAIMSEQGTYSVSGSQLWLRREQYKGEYNVYGKRTNVHETRLEPRVFDVAMSNDGRRLVLKGKAFEYTIHDSHDGSMTHPFSEVFDKQ